MTDYHAASQVFKSAWAAGRKAAKAATKALAAMVHALEGDGYTRTAAIEKIAKDHRDLEGFSRATLYRNLPPELKREYTPAPTPKLSEKGNSGSVVSTEMSHVRHSHGDFLKKSPNRDNIAEDGQLADLQATVRAQAETIQKLQASAQKVTLDCTCFWLELNMAYRNGVKAFLTIKNGHVTGVKLENEE